jgi:hypothetical protein
MVICPKNVRPWRRKQAKSLILRDFLEDESEVI